jgi:hypothetical protein
MGWCCWALVDALRLPPPLPLHGLTALVRCLSAAPRPSSTFEQEKGRQAAKLRQQSARHSVAKPKPPVESTGGAAEEKRKAAEERVRGAVRWPDCMWEHRGVACSWCVSHVCFWASLFMVVLYRWRPQPCVPPVPTSCSRRRPRCESPKAPHTLHRRPLPPAMFPRGSPPC